MSEDLRLVFTGSMIEAGYIKELLEENNIGVILRNSLRESVISGWVSGAPEDSTRLLVATENEEAAKKIVEAYFESN